VTGEAPSKENTMVPLSDKSICIVGPRRLQNELIVSFLEQQTGAKCVEYEDLSRIPAIDDKSGSQLRLILCDCLEKDPDSCMADLDACGENILSRDYVVLFNVRPGVGIEEKALRRGVKGFFYEEESFEKFPKGVAAILNGELWVSRDIMAKFIPEGRGYDSAKKESSMLTPREIEILSLVAIGAKNEEIADRLYISPNTVKTHIYNIFKKINVPNRLQAALWAAKNL
jgi:LuxR family transcriptional regulator of csgAB operon